MEALLPLIIQLISGAAGGNIAGNLMKNSSLGFLGNSIAGIAGGGIGATILNMLLGGGIGAGGMDIASIIGMVASGGVGGGVVMAIIGLIRSMMARTA